MATNIQITEGGESPMDNMMKRDISVRNFIEALTHPIRENEKKYDEIVKKADNEVVKRFQEDVLDEKNITSLPIEKAVEYWTAYYDGHQMREAYPLKAMFMAPTTDQVTFWKKVFEGPIEDIYKLGRIAVAQGLTVLSAANFLWQLEQRYEKCFESEDPNEWIENHKLHRPLFYHPDHEDAKTLFPLASYREKASAILMNEISPNNQ